MELTIQDYRNHLPSNTITDAAKFQAFEFRALFKYVRRYLGDELFADLIGNTPPAELVEKVKPALVNFAYLESIPFFNLILTSTGYGIVSNPNIAPASMERIRALSDACLAAANEGVSQLLLHLEGENNSEWNKCSIITGSLVPNTNVFNTATGLNISRMVFVDVAPHIRSYEALNIANQLSDEYVEELAAGTDTKIKPMAQKALAFAAYHYFTNQPIFNKQGNPVPQEPKYLNMAQKYLKKALSLLNANPDAYPTYKQYGYEPPYDNAGPDAVSMFIGGLTS